MSSFVNRKTTGVFINRLMHITKFIANCVIACTKQSEWFLIAITPTLIISFNLGSTPLSQLPKIFETLSGEYKAEPIWMVDHIDQAN
jgi:hypothetical protein